MFKFKWMKWREALGVFGDNKKMPFRLKDEYYKVVVKPVMLYGSECWVINNKMD